MRTLKDVYSAPPELVLGTELNTRVPEADQRRQREEVVQILERLRTQPGVILADEVGMGKTFVALAVAYAVAMNSPRGAVIVMVPANLIGKWEQDLKTFCELYLQNRTPVQRDLATRRELTSKTALRYGIARHSVELMKLLDDPAHERCHLIFLAQGAMGRRQTDKWIRLALIGEALRKHGRGKASRLIQVKATIHRYLAELLWAIGEQRANDWGDELWQRLLHSDPSGWKEIYNRSVHNEARLLNDDPVPKAVERALGRVNLADLADALKRMPVRARGGDERVTERLNEVRHALRKVEDALWKDLLNRARWRSPLLVMDEAHHLKNPGSGLARQLQSREGETDLRTGDGAMANSFDRMLFLTATPFQLGHHELVRVLERFGDVHWDPKELEDKADLTRKLAQLRDCLDESQRTAISLQRAWSPLTPDDCGVDVEAWWAGLLTRDREDLTYHHRSVVDAYRAAKTRRDAAEAALKPWLVRHNKRRAWADTNIVRRERVEGGQVVGIGGRAGLPIPPSQLLPFFLAARAAVNPQADLLGEALSSSFEAFHLTREKRTLERDDQEDKATQQAELAHAKWYLGEFRHALERCTGAEHPKVHATVRKVVDLWERGEKVLVFAFYRQTCRALRIHISSEIDKRITTAGQRQLVDAGRSVTKDDIEQLLEKVQRRYFNKDAPGRAALDEALQNILVPRMANLKKAGVPAEQREALVDVMRRYLRVPSTLVRCFPLAELETAGYAEAIRRTLDHLDESGVTWRSKFDSFIEFLTTQCSEEERRGFLEAALRTQTGGIRVEGDAEDDDGDGSTVTLANVQVATGTTRRDTRTRLMRAFNTPFFPDILVCSQVMGEGVDLQRFCRHVIHHDLDWNPSTIEQRTGRIDRLGCKAEGRHPIVVYLPYVSGAADERQFRVMSEREQWFRVVMGQDEVAKLITPDSNVAVPLPAEVAENLAFDLSLPQPKLGR